MAAAIVLAVLNAIAAVPKFVGYAESIAAAVTSWLIARSKADVNAALANAAAIASRAENQDDRIKACLAWKDALAKSRVSQ